MYESVNNEDRSPVAYLVEDIQNAFESCTNKLAPVTQKAILRMGIAITLNYGDIPFSAPKVKLVYRNVVLNETYLSFLWTCCYAMVGLNAIYYQMAELNQLVTKFDDHPDYPLVGHTLDWGRTLKTARTPWPEGIANPTQTSEYVVNANKLMVAVVVYQLFHELGHLILHSSAIRFIKQVEKPFYTTTPEDRRKLRMMELQADDFAFNCLNTSSDTEDEKFIKYLGAVVAHLSDLYLLDVADSRSRDYHPDADERLRKAIKNAKLVDEGHQMQLNAMASMGIQIFLSLTNLPFIPEVEKDTSFKDFDALQEYLFTLINKKKQEATAMRR
jgi:hypothetical protein